MYKYSLYGLTIESEVELFQLVTADENSPVDVSIRLGSVSDEVLKYLEEKKVVNRRYEIGFNYSCFHNKGGYYVIRDGKEIVFEMKEGYDIKIVSSWILGFCFAMLLLQRQTLAVHCSAVTDGKRTILISGEPGAGKSTLTRRFLEKGYKLMADDVAAVKIEGDNAVVYPGFPYQKLVRNEVESRNLDISKLIYINEDKDKFLVPVEDDFESEPQVLNEFVFLIVGDVPELKFEQLSGLKQLFAIKNNLFLHKLPGPWENEKELIEECLAIASKCNTYLFVRPREGDSTVKIMEKLSEVFDSRL